MGKSPARCNHLTGEIFLNYRMWPWIPKWQKKFIIAHEEGHLVKNTEFDDVADRYALEKFHRNGWPLSQAVKALTHYLDEDLEAHRIRANYILNLAKKYDEK